MLKNCTLLFLVLFSISTYGQTISGELKKWHTITIEFTDDETYTETGTPNPFLDRRLNVTFTHLASGKIYVVPGYFAADGNAAETSATSGNKFHVKFSPDEIGVWNYSASFREGAEVAVAYPSSQNNGSASTGIDGANGTFTITPTNKTGIDNRAKGRLVYDGTRYPKFSETGKYFIKAGPDSPENFLAFEDFDEVYGGNSVKGYSSHIGDWDTSDPQWQGTKGRGIIGAVNYLSNMGMNSISFLTMNKNRGDSRDVTMHIDDAVNNVVDYTKYDVSRVAQWEIVFSHAETKGMFLHFKTQEQENAAQLNNGSLGTERKLYYRELIARFGHHLALNWNMGEENEGSSAQAGLVNTTQRIAQLKYVKDIDPYQHIRVVHSAGSNTGQNAMYTALLGTASELNGVSMQVLFQNNHVRVKYWVDQSENAGKPWVISSDENSTGGVDNQSNRENYLYGTYFAGGYGVEYYFQGEDQSLQNFRSVDKPGIWEKTKYALDFMNIIPFTEMEGDDSLVSGSGNQCFYKNNDTYAIYLPQGNDNPTVDINNTGNTYIVKWYDVRNGGALQNGTVTSLTSNGAAPNIGLPPSSTASDWVALITNNAVASNPQLSINNVAVTEGGNAIFNVTLTNAASGPFSVGFTTVDGTAFSGSDYTANSGTLNFDGPPETKTITIATIDDALSENSEQFTVNLSNATNGVEITDGIGVATITDNDPAAKLSINDASVTEGENLIFTITLDNAVAGGFAVNYSSADNSATFGEDYTGGSGTVSFSGTAGEEQIITIPTIDDILVEGDEQFVVNLGTSSTSVSFDDDQGLATIIDNDFPPSSVSINDITIAEGNNAVFTVTLDNPIAGGFTVDFATQDNSAMAGTDYNTTNGTLTFVGTTGETQTVTIATIDDATVESNEQFFVNLTNASNSVTIADNQGVATITDNDAPANITINNVTTVEGLNAVFTVTVDNQISGGFTVDFATQDNSAIAGTDYTANNGTLTFAGTAGETQTLTIATIDDATVESNEQFFVNLINASSAVTIADNQGVATITDNDAAASITINDITIVEGSNAILTVTLDNPVSGGFTVDYATQDNSAIAGADYTMNSGTLTFAGNAGETQSITITTIDDTDIEANEQFFVNLSNASNSVTIADNQGVATITDNDNTNPPITIQINDATAKEGEELIFTITLSAESTENIAVTFSFLNETASDLDYESLPMQLIFEAGQITNELRVPLLEDNEIEIDETFLVQIASVDQGQITNPEATAIGTIVDNTEVSIVVYPVPLQSGGTLNLEGLENGQFILSIYTMSNKRLSTDLIEVTNNSYSINTSEILATGVYLINLDHLNSGKNIKKRFVINQ